MATSRKDVDEAVRGAQERSARAGEMPMTDEEILCDIGGLTVSKNEPRIKKSLRVTAGNVLSFADQLKEALVLVDNASSEYVEKLGIVMKSLRDKRMGMTSEVKCVLEDVREMVKALSTSEFKDSLESLERVAILCERLSQADKEGILERVLLALSPTQG